VEPYRLVTTDRRWYLVAYDLDRHDWRTFRVDRASSLTITGHTFHPRPLDDPARMVAEGISTSGYSYRAVLLVKAPVQDVARLISPYSGVSERHGDDTRVEMGVDDFDWLAGYLIGLGLEFEVIEPVELRDHMAALAERLHATHRRLTGPSPR
jgi:predicted DNA-binding transcriptional regulator YafY